jgi:hypothetical protein
VKLENIKSRSKNYPQLKIIEATRNSPAVQPDVHQRNRSKKRSAEDNQRHGACDHRRHRHKTGDIPERSGSAARRGRRRLTIRIGRVTEERALHFAQLAYVLHQRGQVQVGRVQHSGLIRPFKTEEKHDREDGERGIDILSIKEYRTHQSAHCGKVDLKVSVQVHMITSMKAPGLKMTFQNELVVARVIATLGVGTVCK